jgi:hypothetical protein
MSERRTVILSFATAYALALVALIVSRLILKVPAEVQIAVAAAVSLLTLYVASVAWPNVSPRWWSGRRRGGRMIANGVLIFTALTLTSVLRESRPDDYSVLAIGLILPLVFVAQVAIDWRPQPVPPA